MLFGRGGSDLSAHFLAATLGDDRRLLKDVKGLYYDQLQFTARWSGL
jgi:aspartokinase